MKIEDEIKINQFGQDVFSNEYMLDIFESLSIEDKRKYIEDIIFLILQSKSGIDDIDKSIELSELKETFTPCVMLRKGINQDNLFKISKLSR